MLYCTASALIWKTLTANTQDLHLWISVNADTLKWNQVSVIFAEGLIEEQPRAAPYQDCSQTATNYRSHIKKTDKDHKLGPKVFQSHYLPFKITVKKMPVGWHLRSCAP